MDGYLGYTHLLVLKRSGITMDQPEEVKITNISDILKSIFSCYAGKHRKYASNQYLLYFSSFFYVNQYSEMSNKMETHSQHKKNRLVKPYILILPLLEDTQYPMSIYFHCSFVENNQ